MWVSEEQTSKAGKPNWECKPLYSEESDQEHTTLYLNTAGSPASRGGQRGLAPTCVHPTAIWDVKTCFQWCYSFINCLFVIIPQKTEAEEIHFSCRSDEQLWENVVWFSICVGKSELEESVHFEVAPILFLDDVAGNSLTCNLRSSFLWWWYDHLDKAAKGEMQNLWLVQTGRALEMGSIQAVLPFSAPAIPLL